MDGAYVHAMASGRASCYAGAVASAQGPGPLAPVHRITIITAFLGALAYLAWELNQLIRHPDAESLVLAVLAAGVAVALGFYLRNLRARLVAKLTPQGPRRPVS
jgi:hypothetical protein